MSAQPLAIAPLPRFVGCSIARRHRLRSEIMALLMILLFLPSVSPGQPGGSAYARSFGEDVSDFFVGIGDAYLSPLDWRGDQWIDVAAAGLVTGTAFLLDDESRMFMARNRGGLGDGLAEMGRTYGEASYALVLASGVYAAGLLTNAEWVRGTGFTWLQTLVSAGALNLTLKTLVGRSRPYVNSGNHEFDFWSWNEESFSFPSGHTVVAFSLSSVLAARLKNTWATALLYGLAGVTAWSRMYTDDHWLSDVVVGAAFTTAIGMTLVRRYEGSDGQRVSGSGAAVRVGPTPRGLAITIVF